MRKLLALLLVFSLAVTTATNIAYAQEDTTATEEVAADSAATEEMAPMEEEPAAEQVAAEADEAEQLSGFQILKKYFIDGDWKFMSFVLICLILGLAFCIE